MFKKIFFHTVSTLMLTLILSNPGFISAPAEAQSLASPQQRTLYPDKILPSGLAAIDWLQIQTLVEQQDSLADISPMTVDSTAQMAYLKASNTGELDAFGWSVAASGDTVVVGAPHEDSNTEGVNGNQANDLADDAGAVFVFVRSGLSWSQQAYLKASNTDADDNFGTSVAISGDTIVVGAYGEDSNATVVNGNQNDDSASSAGAAYVFVRSGTDWSQQAYLKPSNTSALSYFGWSVAISGNTAVIGADLADTAYVFVRSGTNWSQQTYLKGSNTEAGDCFGESVAISGNTVVIGARFEASSSPGVNGNQDDNGTWGAGAAYVFLRSGISWSQQAYLKASNPGEHDYFGRSVAVSGDTVVVGSWWEWSNATGVNGDQDDNSAEGAGAAYVFVRSGTTWSQQAYLKASNTDPYDFFGETVAVEGNTIVIGAPGEQSRAKGVNGDQTDDSLNLAGAVYVFIRSGTSWRQQAYLKASNTGVDDEFGDSVAVSRDMAVIGAPGEASNAFGVNGNQNDNSAASAGAAYIFKIKDFCYLPIILN